MGIRLWLNSGTRSSVCVCVCVFVYVCVCVCVCVCVELIVYMIDFYLVGM